MTKAINEAREYSEAKVAELRRNLTQAGIPPAEIVVTCGSYARREASAESDIDYFFIVSDAPGAERADNTTHPWVLPSLEKIKKIVPIEPAAGGAFSQVESTTSILQNIGGEHDSNAKITRRMLFLLEGEWLFNEAGFKAVRRSMLERYIGEGMTDHQLALFLLNDIIRYYRTIAVDYEFKTNEGNPPKPWGIRNIKLVFSRKLLYASGVFSVALTADRTRQKKIEILEQLFDLPVIERMTHICGEARMRQVLHSYDYFLERLAEKKVRDQLNALDERGRTNLLFRELKNEGHHFTRELLRLFEDTFDSTHPIRRAVLF